MCSAVAENEEADTTGELSPFIADALRLSVGASLLLLFGMRICHYGEKIPRPDDPPRVRRLLYTWWFAFGVACLIPFVVAPSSLDPIHSLVWPSALVLILCVVESWFTHILEVHLPSEETAPLYPASTASGSPSNYDSIH